MDPSWNGPGRGRRPSTGAAHCMGHCLRRRICPGRYGPVGRHRGGRCPLLWQRVRRRCLFGGTGSVPEQPGFFPNTAPGAWTEEILRSMPPSGSGTTTGPGRCCPAGQPEQQPGRGIPTFSARQDGGGHCPTAGSGSRRRSSWRICLRSSPAPVDSKRRYVKSFPLSAAALEGRARWPDVHGAGCHRPAAVYAGRGSKSSSGQRRWPCRPSAVRRPSGGKLGGVVLPHQDPSLCPCPGATACPLCPARPADSRPPFYPALHPGPGFQP